MEKELKTVIALLNEHSVQYWMDHGTLLGLVRNGKPIENDTDIDISMWAENEDILREKVIPAMKDIGYSVRFNSYHGMNFQYKFNKKKNSEAEIISIDIRIVRLAGNYAWSPQPYLLNNPFKGILSKPYWAITVILWSFLEFCVRLASHSSMTSWPLRMCNQVGTRWAPAHFFKNLTKLEEWDCFIPRDWDEYLTFKYRDWRIPHKGSWNFWTMEGGLIHKDSLSLVKENEQARSCLNPDDKVFERGNRK